MRINSVQQDNPQMPPDVDPAIVTLLAHRFGDGFVYLRGQEERVLYEQAKNLGLISCDGYLTSVGRSVIVRDERG